MFALNRRNGILLLYSLTLLGVALPHFPSLVHSNSHNTGPTMVNQIVSTIQGSSSVKIVSGQVSGQAPVIQGWGGVTLDEASNGQMGSTLLRLNQSGYNGVRVGFSAGITSCSSGELGSWNPDLLNQTIQTAKQYGMWVILDYHSYTDLVDISCQTQWLSFWNSVLTTNWGYSRIVWEPINEPAGSVSVLSSAYQAWITQARGLGDAHWIAVENTISNEGCSFDPLSLANCYPTITDPLNETFLSIHPYLFYDIWLGNGYGICSPNAGNTWGNSTAECVANVYNQGMLQASSKYHLPILDTEGGAVYYSCNNVCANPPDAVGTDDASYSSTTLHFIQYLTNLMGSETMGWLWWEAGEGSCCGALDTWGSLLRFQPVTPPISNDAPPTITAPSGNVVVAGSTVSFKVNASDPDIPMQNLTLSCANCPIGASFPTANGLGQVTAEFSWTPTAIQTGQLNITFTVSDGKNSSHATIQITVYPANGPPHNTPPILIIPGNQTVSVAATLSFFINATDSNTPAQTLLLTCANCATLGATILAATGTSPVTGTFSWAPSANRVPGSYFAYFAATNGVNVSIATVPITVTKVRVEMVASVNPRSITLGLPPVSAIDTATLVGGFNPTGSVMFAVFFSNKTCTGTPLFTSTMILNGNGNYPSQQFTPLAPGSYQWETSYDGDFNNLLVATLCGNPNETLVVNPASTPPQPPSRPSNPSNQPTGTSLIESPTVLLMISGTAGLAVVVVTLYRRRIKRVDQSS